MIGSFEIYAHIESDYGESDEIGYSEVGQYASKSELIHRAKMHAVALHIVKNSNIKISGSDDIEDYMKEMSINVYKTQFLYFTKPHGQRKRKIKKVKLTKYQKKSLERFEGSYTTKKEIKSMYKKPQNKKKKKSRKR